MKFTSKDLANKFNIDKDLMRSWIRSYNIGKPDQIQNKPREYGSNDMEIINLIIKYHQNKKTIKSLEKNNKIILKKIEGYKKRKV